MWSSYSRRCRRLSGSSIEAIVGQCLQVVLGCAAASLCLALLPQQSFLPGSAALSVPPQLSGMGRVIGKMVLDLRRGAALRKLRMYNLEIASQCVLMLSVWANPSLNPRVALVRSCVIVVAANIGGAVVRGAAFTELLQTWPDICYLVSVIALTAAGKLKKSQQTVKSPD